eukprot:g1281.t1
MSGKTKGAAAPVAAGTTPGAAKNSLLMQKMPLVDLVALIFLSVLAVVCVGVGGGWRAGLHFVPATLFPGVDAEVSTSSKTMKLKGQLHQQGSYFRKMSVEEGKSWLELEQYLFLTIMFTLCFVMSNTLRRLTAVGGNELAGGGAAMKAKAKKGGGFFSQRKKKLKEAKGKENAEAEQEKTSQSQPQKGNDTTSEPAETEKEIQLRERSTRKGRKADDRVDPPPVESNTPVLTKSSGDAPAPKKASKSAKKKNKSTVDKGLLQDYLDEEAVDDVGTAHPDVGVSSSKPSGVTPGRQTAPGGSKDQHATTPGSSFSEEQKKCMKIQKKLMQILKLERDFEYEQLDELQKEKMAQKEQLLEEFEEARKSWKVKEEEDRQQQLLLEMDKIVRELSPSFKKKKAAQELRKRQAAAGGSSALATKEELLTASMKKKRREMRRTVSHSPPDRAGRGVYLTKFRASEPNASGYCKSSFGKSTSGKGVAKGNKGSWSKGSKVNMKGGGERDKDNQNYYGGGGKTWSGPRRGMMMPPQTSRKWAFPPDSAIDPFYVRGYNDYSFVPPPPPIAASPNATSGGAPTASPADTNSSASCGGGVQDSLQSTGPLPSGVLLEMPLVMPTGERAYDLNQSRTSTTNCGNETNETMNQSLTLNQSVLSNTSQSSAMPYNQRGGGAANSAPGANPNTTSSMNSVNPNPPRSPPNVPFAEETGAVGMNTPAVVGGGGGHQNLQSCDQYSLQQKPMPRGVMLPGTAGSMGKQPIVTTVEKTSWDVSWV